jgi:hypothetical protein
MQKIYGKIVASGYESLVIIYILEKEAFVLCIGFPYITL